MFVMTEERGIDRPKPIARSAWPALFAYDAPFLSEELLRQRIVATPDEAQELFTELKRYLILVDSDMAGVYLLKSRLVDEVWHQFTLFTESYAAFCQRFFGRYFHHHPSNAPRLATLLASRDATPRDFGQAYHALFGADPPDVWRDECAVHLGRRVMHDDGHGTFSATVENEKAVLMVSQPGEKPTVVLRVDGWGLPGLAFIADKKAFFVREIPGVHSRDKIAIVKSLVLSGRLSIAP